MPSAKPPVTCLECPLHEEECTPHVVLDLNKKDVLVCHKELLAPIVPEKFYILLYQGSYSDNYSSSILVYCIIILTCNIFCFACVARRVYNALSFNWCIHNFRTFYHISQWNIR